MERIVALQTFFVDILTPQYDAKQYYGHFYHQMTFLHHIIYAIHLSQLNKEQLTSKNERIMTCRCRKSHLVEV